MRQNKENAFATVQVTQNAGQSLEKSLHAVATITQLNQDASSIASQQASITNEVSERLNSIQRVGAENQQYAQTVSQNCARLVDEISGMQQQLKRYKY